MSSVIYFLSESRSHVGRYRLELPRIDLQCFLHFMMKSVNSTTLLRPQSPDVQEGDNVFRYFLRIRLRIAAPAQRITPPTSGRNWPCVRVRTRTRMCVYVCVRARTYGTKKH